MKLAMAFLQIPLEIRLSVFREAICSLADQPSCPAVSQKGRKRLSQDAFGGAGIWQLPLRNPALPLLLVNKQIHAEVKDVLERTTTTSYHVDIMYLKFYGLWTTWTIPALPRTQYIDSIHASFRLFEPTKDLDKRFRGSLSFSPGDGGPPLAVWSFHKLLTGVLTDGPGYLGGKRSGMQKGLTPRYAVKRVVVNIVAPIDGAVHKSIIWGDKGYDKRVRPGEDGCGPHDASIPAEQRLADYMIQHLDTILYLNYYTMNYGTVLYEGVLEDITFLVNGTEYKRYDMDELMREHKVNYWGETPELIEQRQQAHAKWKSWVDERRNRMKEGLELDSNRPVTTIM
ncbi:hypothetical protein QBC33DRAFT_549962 [Phialemonium atrogriseum]|uniref:Uncharacterized protein n=1 Tax=Phialemonium atrogriseum TaxID=1093897 RepID=A0AAJ0BUL2_9PEZI|nr:uncharacterized protein QBC33DRAFT_549962 [Phialemonium atrogriseum]KAK1763342.1 hypothetical protein QBC33DRAFT_549962 [Phialemonium atrogriseum]